MLGSLSYGDLKLEKWKNLEEDSLAINLVMGDIVYDNCLLKYHSYCKYYDISKLDVTVQKHWNYEHYYWC